MFENPETRKKKLGELSGLTISSHDIHYIFGQRKPRVIENLPDYDEGSVTSTRVTVFLRIS